MKCSFISFCVALVFLSAASETNARSFVYVDTISQNQSTSTSPAYCIAEHNVGNIAMAVCNDGSFGTGWSSAGTRDCFTGNTAKSCEYPKGAQNTYLWGADLWIGAIVGRDTLVSTCGHGGHEFNPDIDPLGRMKFRSSIDPAKPEYKGAISEQDYVSVYYDTCTNCRGVGTDYLDGRGHRPLHIEVTQSSYAWSYSYAEDFVLMDFAIKNIGDSRLHRVYMGFYVDADVHSLGQISDGYEDDLSGFTEWLPALYLKPPCPEDSDVVNLAWTVDNEGGFNDNYPNTPGAAATRVVRTPADSLVVSYNWWVRPPFDYGPQARATYRDLQTGGLGTPNGDRNKYHYLSNGEMDFAQPYLATITALDSVWIPPPQSMAAQWATGIDVRYLLSFGPFDIEPGQSLPISLAYVCGPDFHQNAANFQNLPDDPDAWFQGVNFDSLGVNATWADWVYDNPGVDTDSDGYAGEFTVCNLGTDSSYVCDTFYDTTADPDTVAIVCGWKYDLADTVWRKGDGVPDFRGATPPPAPSSYSVTDPVTGEVTRGLRVESSTGKLTVRWNGALTETTRDVFSRELDFEGYRVWISRDDRVSSYSVVASYDLEDYNRFEWVDAIDAFDLLHSPFTLDELRCMYADSCNDETWHPDQYPRSHPLVISSDEVYYFEPQDYNQSILGNDAVSSTTPIRKVYPDALKPPVVDVDSIRALFPDTYSLYLTDQGFIKYYEYELEIDGLLPTVPYWVNVTAFDYGSPESGLAALETSQSILPANAYPTPSVNEIATSDLDAFCYPNPYRADGDYRSRGLEGRGRADLPDDRVRRVHFANLPARCRISIFSLDGDLVRVIDHDYPESDPLATHDSWDLITRNSQLAVSGLYYWTVEEDGGETQIGKLVLIM